MESRPCPTTVAKHCFENVVGVAIVETLGLSVHVDDFLVDNDEHAAQLLRLLVCDITCARSKSPGKGDDVLQNTWLRSNQIFL